MTPGTALGAVVAASRRSAAEWVAVALAARLPAARLRQNPWCWPVRGQLRDLPRAVARAGLVMQPGCRFLHRHGGYGWRAARCCARGVAGCRSRAGAARGTRRREGWCLRHAGERLARRRPAGRTGAVRGRLRGVGERARDVDGRTQGARELAYWIVSMGCRRSLLSQGFHATAVLRAVRRDRVRGYFPWRAALRVPAAPVAGPMPERPPAPGLAPPDEGRAARAARPVCGTGPWPWRSIADRGRASATGRWRVDAGGRGVFARLGTPTRRNSASTEPASACCSRGRCGGPSPELVACEPATGLLSRGSSRAGPGRRRTCGVEANLRRVAAPVRRLHSLPSRPAWRK